MVTRQRKLHRNKLGANTVGKEKKRKESRQKEAGVEVACRGHLWQGGIQKGKKKKKGQKNKQTRATTYNMRRARKATIYIYKWCKTAQIGRQSKDKDNGIK